MPKSLTNSLFSWGLSDRQTDRQTETDREKDRERQKDRQREEKKRKENVTTGLFINTRSLIIFKIRLSRTVACP